MRILLPSVPFLLLPFALAAPSPADDAANGEQAPRVEVGQEAPDVSLPAAATGGSADGSKDDEVHALGQLRGEKDVILIFFRGSW